MASIFISHSTADSDIADLVATFLMEAIGVPMKEVFCSSKPDHGIPLGEDFSVYMSEQLKNQKLVIALFSPTYMESNICLMELGAAWTHTGEILPLIIPPSTFENVRDSLGQTQGTMIGSGPALNAMKKMIEKLGIVLEERGDNAFERKKAAFTTALSSLLENVAPAKKIHISAVNEIRNEMKRVQLQHERDIKQVEQERDRMFTALTSRSDNEPSTKVTSGKTEVAGTLTDKKFDLVFNNAVLTRKIELPPVKQINSNSIHNIDFNNNIMNIKNLKPKSLNMRYYIVIIMDYFGNNAVKDLQNREAFNVIEYLSLHGYILNNDMGELDWNGKLSKLMEELHNMEKFFLTTIGSLMRLAYNIDYRQKAFWEKYLLN